MSRPDRTAEPDQASSSGRGSLVLVATPIGNLADLSPRAVEALRSADLICCEDTRRTRVLLSACGIGARDRLVALHAHNEASRTEDVLSRVMSGQQVAVVSDAGTPTISDPGQRLVESAIAMDITVTTVPGPSSVIAALSISGLSTERFCVEGFLPRRGKARAARIESILREPRTVVIMEAPTRLAATLGDLSVALADRRVAVARELTKVHEEVWRGTVSEGAEVFASRQVRGEVVIVLEGSPEPEEASDLLVAEAVRERLAAGDGPRQAADAVATGLGVPRRRAYELALSLRAKGL